MTDLERITKDFEGLKQINNQNVANWEADTQEKDGQIADLRTRIAELERERDAATNAYCETQPSNLARLNAIARAFGWQETTINSEPELQDALAERDTALAAKVAAERENERLRRSIALFEATDKLCTQGALMGEVRKMQTELTALREDAAALDWLEATVTGQRKDTRFIQSIFIGMTPDREIQLDVKCENVRIAPTLRAAIAAARTQEGK